MQLHIFNRTDFLQMPGKVKTNGTMVSTRTASEILGVSLPRVRRMILDGFFEGVEKFGQNSAIPLKEVERVARERAQMAKSAGGKIKGGRPRKSKAD